MKKTAFFVLVFILFSVFIVPEALAQIPIPETGLPDPQGGIRAILVGILNWLLGILGFLGIIGFAVSGIMYLISTGDDTMIKRAKSGMLYSIVGMVVGLAGVVLIRTIDSLLNAQNQGSNTEYNNQYNQGTDNDTEYNNQYNNAPAVPDGDGPPPGYMDAGDQLNYPTAPTGDGPPPGTPGPGTP